MAEQDDIQNLFPDNNLKLVAPSHVRQFVSEYFSLKDDLNANTIPSLLSQIDAQQQRIANLEANLLDNEPPVIHQFTSSDVTGTTIVPITLVVTDNFSPVKYFIRVNDSTKPTPQETGWEDYPVYLYALPDFGTWTLDVWAMDQNNNITPTSLQLTVTATGPSSPVVNRFVATLAPDTLNATIELNASNATHWQFTNSATPPSATLPGSWTAFTTTPFYTHSSWTGGAEDVYVWVTDGTTVSPVVAKQTLTPQDTIDPSIISDFALAPGTDPKTQIVATWSAATDTSGIKRYDIWDENGVVVRSGVTSGVEVSGLIPNTPHKWRVVAIDNFDNDTPSNEVTLTTATGPAPPVINSFSATLAANTLFASVTITATGHTHWLITENTATVPALTDPGWSAAALPSSHTVAAGYNNGQVALRVWLKNDTNGIVSAPFAAQNVTPSDTTAPTAPTSVALVNPTNNSLDVTFTSGTDSGSGIKRHDLIDDATGSVIKPGLISGETIGNLPAGTSHTWRVRAIDNFDNFTDSTPATNSTSSATPVAAFSVQHGTNSIGVSGGTQAVTAVSSVNSAIELLNNARYSHGANPTLDPLFVEGNDMSGAFRLTSTSLLTFYRDAAAAKVVNGKFQWSVWEYIGAGGGPNEFIVRGRYQVALNGTTNSTTQAVSGISNAKKCIPFIIGIENNATNNDADSATAMAYLESATVMRVKKGSQANNVTVHIVLVEFTGSNWTVLHGDSGLFSSATGTFSLRDGADGTGTITGVGSDWNHALIFSGFHADTSTINNDRTADLWPIVRKSSSLSAVDWEFVVGHVSDGGNRLFAHVLINPDMTVTRYQDATLAAGETTIDITSAGLTSLSESLIVGHAIAGGTDNSYPRAWRNFYFNSLTQAAHWGTTTLGTANGKVEIQVAKLPQDASGSAPPPTPGDIFIIGSPDIDWNKYVAAGSQDLPVIQPQTYSLGSSNITISHKRIDATGALNAIRHNGGSNFVVENCEIYGAKEDAIQLLGSMPGLRLRNNYIHDNNKVPSLGHGFAVWFWMASGLPGADWLIAGNWMEDNAGGVQINNADDLLNAQIRYNFIKNSHRYFVNGQNGNQGESVMFANSKNMRGVKVHNNTSIATFDLARLICYINDHFNMYKSGGIAGNPVVFTKNHVRGGSNTGAGTGFIANDHGSEGYIDIIENILVDTGAVGLNFAGGRNLSYLRNKIFSSRNSPESQAGISNVGASAWRYSDPGTFFNGVFSGNEMQWWSGKFSKFSSLWKPSTGNDGLTPNHGTTSETTLLGWGDADNILHETAGQNWDADGGNAGYTALWNNAWNTWQWPGEDGGPAI